MIKKIREVWSGVTTEKISPLLMLLVVLNTVAMLVANIIAGKIFSVGIGVLPSAVIIFPLTYVLSDVFSELDYKWSRRTCHIAFLANLFMVALFSIVIAIPGIDPEKADSFSAVLGTTPWALAASLIAFFVGDYLNDKIFQKMKSKDGDTKFTKRAVLSSLAGEFIDSFVYIPLGMNILPKLFLGFEFMTWEQITVAIPLQALVKTTYEILISPLTYKLIKKLKALKVVD